MPKKKSQPPLEDELENKCQQILTTGDRCKLDHIEDSLYCHAHEQESKGVALVRAQAKARVEAAREEFIGQEHAIETRRDVQKLVGRVINGIIQGDIKRDTGGMLGVFLPLAWKMAKELEGTGTAATGKKVTNIININQNENSINVQMTDREIDQFLAGDETVKVTLLETIKESGRISPTEKRDIVLKTKEIKDENIRMSPATIAAISKGTDAEISKQDAIDLFGDVLGDTAGLGPVRADGRRIQSTAGFDHLFEPGGLPEEVPDPRHTFGKPVYELDPGGFSIGWYVCEKCGVRKATKHGDEECPATLM